MDCKKEGAKSAGRWEQNRSQLGLIGVLYLSFKAWVSWVGFGRFECLRMIFNLFGILKLILVFFLVLLGFDK